MKIEFEKQFGKGVDPWYAKAERWAKKQKFPISFLALGFIEWLKNKWIDMKVANAMKSIDIQAEEIKKIWATIQKKLGKEVKRLSMSEVRTNKYREKKGLPPIKKK